MSSGKVKTRITITVDPDVLALVNQAVDAGAARSVSAFFEWAALDSLDADAAYVRMLDEILEETGGPPTPEEREESERRLGLRP
ncbi:MAG TPA: hypothetical protein VNS19_06020 [Acidimicrobiales bacterium]|jgi:hypothetical protein|nr:hypothetical protein [Acidimicrobiales bacterium]